MPAARGKAVDATREPEGHAAPGLATDLYELTMAASYLRRGMQEPATFTLFVRRLPPQRGYLVAAGLEDSLRFLETFSLDDSELEWLSRHGFTDDEVARLGTLRFSGDVAAVPEGRVVLAGEPLLQVTAPIAEAQVVETYLLNQMTFHTTVASKAARCVVAAGGLDPDGGIELVDFSMRRTAGLEAAMAVARDSAIAGFSATSNVEAARRFELRPSGTMAHSYVEAFPSERDAFTAFAQDRPGPVTFLVDTYDTMRGVDAAADTIQRLGIAEAAVRLDSGDLAALARRARRRLDRAGLREVRILVSGGLDEHDLDRFRRDGVPVDAAGVGTRLGVSADAPSLDSAYKLVVYAGRPVCKLSAGKVTLPGAKQVWRRPGIRDVIGLADEAGPAGGLPLLEPVMQGGRRLGPPPALADARRRCREDLLALPAEALATADPVPPAVRLTPALRNLARVSVAALRPR